MATIIVTGAGGNLGKTVTSYFRSQGHRVIGIWSPGKRPSENSQTDVEADLRDENATASCIESIQKQNGKIDVLLALAGGFDAGSIEETSLEVVKRMIALNFDTSWNVVKPVLSQMKKQTSPGRIVLIGARPAYEPERAKSMVAYALSKSMITELAKVVNASAKPHDIVCSVVVPGTIDTPQNREFAGNADTTTWVTPLEICRSIEYLISSEGTKLREPILRLYGN
ncbi:MAG: SDR family NAD(P)-dependent oxidoreductase [Cyclobacteriaceae bacterium]